MALAGKKHDTGQALKIGLLDADVYGPSVPQLMNLHGRPETGKGEISPQQSQEALLHKLSMYKGSSP